MGREIHSGLQAAENWNSANTVPHQKDGRPDRPTRSTPRHRCSPCTCSRSALVHINTPLLQQVLSEPTWASRLTGEGRRGLTALFWSNVNP